MKVRSFQCFETWQGFDTILPINIIVGRNNAGKSALLDFVAMSPVTASHYRAGQPPQYEFAHTITREDVLERIPNTDSRHFGFGIPDQQCGLDWCVGLRIVINVDQGDQTASVFTDGRLVNDKTRHIALGIVPTTLHPFANPIKRVRLRADRNIVAELKSIPRPDHLGEDGTNATRLIEACLHDEGANHELVETHLLKDLNKIINPDWVFTGIKAKQKSNDTWELHLQTQNGLWVPLSQTGSGIKTLLLVLIEIHLVPHAQKKPTLSEYVFCFEELENNLHPAVQRRLFGFLRDKAVKEECTFFITTHSNVVIDMFSRDDKAQLLHVKHDGTAATVEAVSSHIKRCGVFLDLDVRASDLLQSNALVWVEGPSDRIYFNRWVDLWSREELREGTHYQCVWYGGSLLADMSFEDPDRQAELGGESEEEEWDSEKLVNALQVNRNAIVLMDSDRRGPNDSLKPRVVKVRAAIEGTDGVAWVTAGREVENYIPPEALSKCGRNPINGAPGCYADVFQSLGYKVPGNYPKLRLAKRVTQHISREMLAATHDLAEKLDLVCRQIRKWNGLPEQQAAPGIPTHDSG
jgi:putative ATP-dependent endonuclease of OLD family